MLPTKKWLTLLDLDVPNKGLCALGRGEISFVTLSESKLEIETVSCLGFRF